MKVLITCVAHGLVCATGLGQGGVMPCPVRETELPIDPNAWVEAMDLDSDGHTDLLVRDLATGETSAYLGDGALGFTFVPPARVNMAVPPGGQLMEARDFDADGDVDFLSTNRYVYFNETPRGFDPATDSIEFAAVRVDPSQTGAPINNDAEILGAADIDHDGRDEFVVIFSTRDGLLSGMIDVIETVQVQVFGQVAQPDGVTTLSLTHGEEILRGSAADGCPARTSASNGSDVDTCDLTLRYTGYFVEQINVSRFGQNGGTTTGGAGFVIGWVGEFGTGGESRRPAGGLELIEITTSSITRTTLFEALNDFGGCPCLTVSGWRIAAGDFDGSGNLQAIGISEVITPSGAFQFRHAFVDLETGQTQFVDEQAFDLLDRSIDWDLDGLDDFYTKLNDGDANFPSRGGTDLPYEYLKARGEILTAGDFNGDGFPDIVERVSHNGVEHLRILATVTGPDDNQDGFVDRCQRNPDENANDIIDWAEIAAGSQPDCNGNFRIDFFEIDANQNGIPDDCDLMALPALDDNGDGLIDDAVPNFRARLFADPDGLVPGLNFQNMMDVSENGLVLMAAASDRVRWVYDTRSGSLHNLGQNPSGLIAGLEDVINQHGEIAGAGALNDREAVVVWAGSIDGGGLEEVARITRQNGEDSASVPRVLGLTDEGVLFIEVDFGTRRVAAVDIRAEQSGEPWPLATNERGVAVAGSNVVLSKVRPFGSTPPDLVVADRDGNLIVKVPQQGFSTSRPRQFEVSRGGANERGWFATHHYHLSLNSNAPSVVVYLPNQFRDFDPFEMYRPDVFMPNPATMANARASAAWITNSGAVVGELDSDIAVWPTAARPDISFDLLDLVVEAPTDFAIGNGIRELAGVNGSGTFLLGDDWLIERIPTPPLGLDLNGDTDVTLDDLVTLLDEIAAPTGTTAADPDLNDSGAVDQADADAFAAWLLSARRSELPDCNTNLVPDLAELTSFGGVLPDADEDLRLDECAGGLLSFLLLFESGAAVADTNGDRVVDFFDVLEVLEHQDAGTGP